MNESSDISYNVVREPVSIDALQSTMIDSPVVAKSVESSDTMSEDAAWGVVGGSVFKDLLS